MSEEAQNELPLADEPQKDEFAAKLEEAADQKVEDQNDPNDLNNSEADEKAEQVEAKAEESVKEEAKEEPVKDEADEVEQLRKTVKALGKRVSTLSREKRELHTKLQDNIKPVAEQAAEESEAPKREDFKTKAEFDVAVRAEAERIRAVEDFNSKCNAVEAAGSEK